MVHITFLPDNKSLKTSRKNTVLEALHAADIHVVASCGGEQVCGECRVRIEKSPPDFLPVEEAFFTSDELQSGWRLACCHTVEENMVVFVPDEFRIKTEKVTSSSLESTFILNPGLFKQDVALDGERLKDGKTLTSVILNQIENTPPLHVPLSVMRKFSGMPNGSKGAYRIVYSEQKVFDIRHADSGDALYGVALDIGTTTVAGLLIDLSTGDTVAMQTAVNEQSSFGADVMSRINYAISHDNGEEVLSGAIHSTVDSIISGLTEKAGISADMIYSAVVVGNTAMFELFLKMPPHNLAYSPYLPVTTQGQNLTADETGLNINPDGMVRIFPVISGFVGGDMVGVILSSEMDRRGGFTAAIDLGTNGEIVIGEPGRLIAAATAAGPAFEGAVLSCGMPAMKGAVSSFRITESGVDFTTIGGSEPKGICGSGLIDIIAELLYYGIIDSRGKITPDNAPEFLKDRIIKNESVYSFIIYKNGGRNIYISQKDVREFQLGKGAIRAGIAVLSRILEKEEKNLDEIMVAGSFGTYVRKESIIRTGLLPDIPVSKIRIIGNAACLGAKRALVNRDEFTRAGEIAQAVEAVNLAARADFQEEFMNSVVFPEQSELSVKREKGS